MDQDYFKKNVFSHKDEMFRFAKSILVSRDEAEDIVQDLMMKFWQKREELQRLSNIKSYVLKAVKNECLNRLKHENVKLGFAEFQKDRGELYKMEVNNMKEEILKLIAQLPEKQRMVIHLKDVEDYDVAEIGEVLSMEPNAVRINLMRARQKVKEQITALMNYEQRRISR